MTVDQAIVFAVVGAMLALFVWDRLRYDVVALLTLLALALTGVLPEDKALSGFANPVLTIIGAVLVISRAIGNAGAIEVLMRRLQRGLVGPSLEIGALSAFVAALSAFMKNVGALGLFLPIAIRIAERGRRSPSAYLMPMAFASLVGGMITEIGTSPNLLISAIRGELRGHRFQLFDFAPVGVPLTVLTVTFLAVGWRLLPRDRRGQPSPEQRFKVEDYTSEAGLPADSPLVGQTVFDLEELGDGDVMVTAILRDGDQRDHPRGDAELRAGDLLVLQADPPALQRLIERAKLELIGAGGQNEGRLASPAAIMEAVVTGESRLRGATPREALLAEHHGVNLLAVSRRGRRIQSRLAELRLRVGDLLVLQGQPEHLSAVIADLGCLPLAERNLQLGRPRRAALSVGIMAAAMLAIAAGVVPVSIGFLAAAVLMVLCGLITLREAYDAVEWPILILLGALIPVGEALKLTGGTGLLTGWLAMAAQHLPPMAALGLVMAVSMLVTPLMHHAAAVIVMGPIAAGVASGLALNPDAFLMAVAVGASCDFLTPIGHQNNTLVMGPGGYRFGDYWRLGLPLTCLMLLVGTPLIAWVWGLR